MDNNQENLKPENQGKEESCPKRGPISQLLCDEGLAHTFNEPDHIGVEIIHVIPDLLVEIVSRLKTRFALGLKICCQLNVI